VPRAPGAGPLPVAAVDHHTGVCWAGVGGAIGIVQLLPGIEPEWEVTVRADDEATVLAILPSKKFQEFLTRKVFESEGREAAASHAAIEHEAEDEQGQHPALAWAEQLLPSYREVAIRKIRMHAAIVLQRHARLRPAWEQYCELLAAQELLHLKMVAKVQGIVRTFLDRLRAYRAAHMVPARRVPGPHRPPGSAPITAALIGSLLTAARSVITERWPALWCLGHDSCIAEPYKVPRGCGNRAETYDFVRSL
jgi:hypothetical protein